ncbi:MAG TPA: ATP-binding protein [Methylomirabilota bacterium]|nr:ATP-binding protein [Methylomirabilota bacterium]
MTAASELDRLLASLPDAVIGVRPDLTVFLWNDAAEALTGRAATRALGRRLPQCLGPEARLTRHLAETVRLAEGRAEAESELVTAEGRAMPVSVLTAPVRDAAGGLRGAVAVLRDLSRLKALEAEVRRGERLAALGQMALALAHEIRNPLGAIRGVAQLLGDELGPAGPFREHVAVLLAEIDRVNRVMEALLDLGRPMTFAFQPVNLHQLLERVCLLAEPAAVAAAVHLVRRYDPSLPPIWADPDRLVQVFQNLVQNGIEAMSAGGRLTLTTRISLDPVYARVDAGGGFRPMVEVQIADQGEGIAPTLLDRVFDPFVSTKPRGLGLGLALAHRIVEEHRGALRVTSTPGKGATFTCYLPVAAAPAGRDPGPPAGPESPAEGG